MKIAPSLLSANFSDIKTDIKLLEKAGADLIHIDVMDGHFVPNLTVGPSFVDAVKKITDIPLDVHLMVDNPDMWIIPFYKAGASYITVHQEATPHLDGIIQKIHNFGIKAGISICPSTSEETIKYLLYDIDLVLVMSVNPGFGGQKFIKTQLKKVERLAQIREKKHLSYMIEVDGGVNDKNSDVLSAAGADILVAGSFIFSYKNYTDAIALLRGTLCRF